MREIEFDYRIIVKLHQFSINYMKSNQASFQSNQIEFFCVYLFDLRSLATILFLFRFRTDRAGRGLAIKHALFVSITKIIIVTYGYKTRYNFVSNGHHPKIKTTNLYIP